MPLPRPVLLWITNGSSAMGGLRARLYPSGQGHASHAYPCCHDVRNASVVRLDSALDLPRWFLPFASGSSLWSLSLFCFFSSRLQSHIDWKASALPVSSRPAAIAQKLEYRLAPYMISLPKLVSKDQSNIHVFLLEAVISSR